MDQAIRNEMSAFTVVLDGSDAFPEETIRRVQVMLQALLVEAAAPKGEYQLRIKGGHPPFEKFPGPHLEVAEGAVSIAVLIMVRARHGADGSLCGSLYPPEGSNRAALLKDMKIAADAFNRNGDWADVLHHLPPNPPPDGSRGTSRLAPSPAAVVPAVASSPSQPATRTQTQKVPDDEYSRFLKRMLEGKEDGIFTGKQLSEEARKWFTEKPPRWYATGITSELLGKKRRWIRRIGSSQYQVEQLFLDSYPLVGLKLVPRPVMRRRLQSNPVTKASATVVLAQPKDLGCVLHDLASQRVALVAAVDAARRELASREVALQSFDDEMRRSVGALGQQEGEALRTLFLPQK